MEGKGGGMVKVEGGGGVGEMRMRGGELEG